MKGKPQRVPASPLQALRHQAGLTGEQVALNLGVTKTLVSQWECCATKLMPHWRGRLAEMYQCQPEDIRQGSWR